MDVKQVQVLSNESLGGGCFLLRVPYDAHARRARPASFAMLSLPEDEAHVIPRPFSISDAYVDETGVQVAEFLYKVVGAVTHKMSRLRPGDEIRVGGIAGNGFPDPAPGATPVLVAGGIGNAPFALHVRRLLEGGMEAGAVHLLLAGRTAADVFIQDAVRSSGITIIEITEDGSLGEKGLVTDALARLLPLVKEPQVFACGPTPMLRALQAMAKEHGFACHLSLEEHMACGYGVCNACVVERRLPGVPRGSGPYLRLCVDGPVLEATEVHI